MQLLALEVGERVRAGDRRRPEVVLRRLPVPCPDAPRRRRARRRRPALALRCRSRSSTSFCSSASTRLSWRASATRTGDNASWRRAKASAPGPAGPRRPRRRRRPVPDPVLDREAGTASAPAPSASSTSRATTSELEARSRANRSSTEAAPSSGSAPSTTGTSSVICSSPASSARRPRRRVELGLLGRVELVLLHLFLEVLFRLVVRRRRHGLEVALDDGGRQIDLPEHQHRRLGSTGSGPRPGRSRSSRLSSSMSSAVSVSRPVRMLSSSSRVPRSASMTWRLPDWSVSICSRARSRRRVRSAKIRSRSSRASVIMARPSAFASSTSAAAASSASCRRCAASSSASPRSRAASSSASRSSREEVSSALARICAAASCAVDSTRAASSPNLAATVASSMCSVEAWRTCCRASSRSLASRSRSCWRRPSSWETSLRNVADGGRIEPLAGGRERRTGDGAGRRRVRRGDRSHRPQRTYQAAGGAGMPLRSPPSSPSTVSASSTVCTPMTWSELPSASSSASST